MHGVSHRAAARGKAKEGRRVVASAWEGFASSPSVVVGLDRHSMGCMGWNECRRTEHVPGSGAINKRVGCWIWRELSFRERGLGGFGEIGSGGWVAEFRCAWCET